jgi:hypothetical protein
MAMDENERQAAAIKVGISNNVATAALAVLAGVVGIFTYISQAFAPAWTFYLFISLATAALVLSIILGGAGSDSTVGLVAKGLWKNQKTPSFNRQAYLTLFGLVFLLVATAIGATSNASVSETEKIETLKKQVSALQQSITTLESQAKALQPHK